MRNAEVIKGLESVIEGCIRIKDALSEESTKTSENEVVENSEVYSVEQLEAMNYNEFKKYASSLGVKCTGTRDKILERVMEALNLADSVVDEELEDTKSTKSAKSKTNANKKVSKSSEDKFDKQAKEVAKGNSVEEIIEVLSDVVEDVDEDNYLEKLAYALREGLIDLEEDDEEEVEEDEEVNTDEEGGLEFDSASYFEEFDPEGINNPEEMTNKRIKAVEKRMGYIIEAVEDEELSMKDITSYIDDNATDDEKELLEDCDAEPFEKNLMLYMELVKRTIDDDGEEHEPCDPYEIGEENLCCGHVLKYSKKTKKYICEICGTEYEAE